MLRISSMIIISKAMSVQIIQDPLEYLDYTEGFVPANYFVAKRMMRVERDMELSTRAWYEAALLLGMEVSRV